MDRPIVARWQEDKYARQQHALLPSFECFTLRQFSFSIFHAAHLQAASDLDESTQIFFMS